MALVRDTAVLRSIEWFDVFSNYNKFNVENLDFA